MVSDGQGTPLAVHLTACQVHEAKGRQPVGKAVRIAQPQGRPRRRPFRRSSDKAYDIPWIRRLARSHHITAVISEERKPHGRKPKRPFRLDRDAY
ncbi:MAG: hypothetical protein KatS3mg105_5058 [Gemmatales bacterium]|nr:MAG: hypothetical protein KatS3mg105_5058 [Gemmatales bacterium]